MGSLYGVIVAGVTVMTVALLWLRPKARCVLIGLMNTTRGFANGRIRPEDLKGAIFLLSDFVGTTDQITVEKLLPGLVKEGIPESEAAPAATAILRAIAQAEHDGRVATLHAGTTAFTYEDLNEILVRHHYHPLAHNRRMVGDLDDLKQRLEDANPDHLAVWV